MKALTTALAASVLMLASAASKADTVINLNATTGNASTSWGVGNYNNLAPAFFSTLTLGPGTYSVQAIGAGYTGSNGVNSVYSGWSYALGPAGYFSEIVGITSGGSFAPSSAATGYQNSYLVGTTPPGVSSYLFNNGGTYSNAATALAASINTPYLFSLTSPTSLTFYIPDGSYAPTNQAGGFDDNTGGVSLDITNLTAVTPEPSSLLLLATGAVAAAGAVRRRIRVA